jgi:hypothetical protein
MSGVRGRSGGALRPPFQPATRLWQFEGLSVEHGAPYDPVCEGSSHQRCYGAGDEGVAPSLLSRQPMERPVKRNDLS